MRKSVNGDHRCAESVLAEGGILVGAAGIVAFEVLQNGGAQHAFALAVDEDDATPRLFGILLQGLVENAQLTG